MHFKFKHYIGQNTEITVGCDYSPAQKEILYPNDDAQEGFDAQWEVIEVLIDGDDIIECLSNEFLMALEEVAVDNMPEDANYEYKGF